MNANIERSQPQVQYQYTQRKCSMCERTGHTIRQCNDIATRNMMQEKEHKFGIIMKERLSTFRFEQREYQELVTELRCLPKNFMKFAVIKYGGFSSGLTTKLKLFSMYMFQMIRRFINHEYVFMDSISHIKILILNAERSYWLYLSAGNSIRVAENMYNQRVNEIMDEHLAQRFGNEQIVPSLFSIKVNLVTDLSSNNDNIDTNVIHNTFECNICFDTKEKDTKVTFDCGHSFCGMCVQKTFEICKSSYKNPNCAMCRKEYSSVNVLSNNVYYELKQFCE
jgi:hypothetical protein